MALKIECPGETAIELLTLIQPAADLERMEAEVDFDIDDEDAAITELDRMHEALI